MLKTPPLAKAIATKDIIEKNDPDHNDPRNLKVIPPWKSHIDPKVPLPEKIEENPVSKPKKGKVQIQKPVKRYAGLPAPLTTRSKAKQTDITMSSLDYSNLLQQQQPSDQPNFDVDIYDQFFEQRYLLYYITYFFCSRVTHSEGRTKPYKSVH